MRQCLSERRSLLAIVAPVASVLLLIACTSESGKMHGDPIAEFATRYTAAWCSRNPARVASFFADNGSLKINDGAPATGRAAITAAAQSFMTAFPDIVVALDSFTANGTHAVYRWTLTGTNTGPGGTGRAVRIHGYEEWTFGADGLIRLSLGHFDEAEYKRQLQNGVAAAAP